MVKPSMLPFFVQPGEQMIDHAKSRLQSGYRWARRKMRGKLDDVRMYDQFIPVQSVNRTQLDYDVSFYGEHEIYFPTLSAGNDIAKYRELQLHYHPVAMPQPYHFQIEEAAGTNDVLIDLNNPGRAFLENFPEVTQFVEGSNHSVDIFNQERCLKYGKTADVDIDGAYWFSSRGWKNYYHFIVDSCLRYVDLPAQGAVDAQTKIICRNEPTTWQMMYLELLGIRPEQIVVSARKLLKINNLTISSSRRQRFAISPQAIRSFNTAIRAGVDISQIEPCEKFYISRSLSKLRQVENEEALTAHLTARGFRVVHLENMSPQEQIALFSEAKYIVAPHGAGLTNLIYANAPNVIELIPADFWGWGYFIPLTDAVGGRHWPIVGSDREHFHVDIAAVDRALNALGA